MTTDIRNSVVFVAPTSHMPAASHHNGGLAAPLRMLLWGGDPEVWDTSIAGEILTTAAALRDLGAAIDSLIAGAAGPIVTGPFTIDNATHAGRASVSVAWSGGGPFFLDNVPGLPEQAHQAAVLLDPAKYTDPYGIPQQYPSYSYAAFCARALQEISP